MPPWNSLRLGRPSEKDLQGRHSMDPGRERPPSSPDEPLSPDSTGTASATASPRRHRRMRDSIVSLSAVQDRQPTPQEQPKPSMLEVPEDDKTPQRPHRFSLMRFRHASDSQLHKTAKEHVEAAPPVPAAPPSIIKTAPTMEVNKRKSTFSLPRPRRSTVRKKSHDSLHGDRDDQSTPVPSNRSTMYSQLGAHGSSSHPAPPPYGEEHGSLGVPFPRMSESSRSDASSNDHGIYAQTTTTHTVSTTTTTFFRIPRRKKDKGPLFPLPPKTSSNLSSATNTPRMSSSRNSESPIRRSFAYTPESSGRPSVQHSPQPDRSILRSRSRASIKSQASSAGKPKLPLQRGRSSTKSSLRRPGAEGEVLPTPPLPHSTRTSTSTSGRPSLGGLFGVGRMKPGESALTRGLRNGEPSTPGSVGSKEYPFHREPQIVIPERQEGDTPAKYLARLEEVVNQGALVSILSKSEDEFMKNVLRSYMRRFKFFEDPMDIAIRKLLMHVELPKETQQIDRTLQSFADRYHECNPGIFPSVDDAYFIAFSILILHTDVFNKNNKHKMTKQDYVRNTKGQGGCVPAILECFYDNIAYTTFIHLEDDAHFSSERIMAQKNSRRGPLKVPSTSLRRNHSGPVDPYALILDNQLDILRPPLDDILVMEDSFNYLAPNGIFNISELNRTFFRSGVIQILSARSRPEAFANQATVMNPTEAQVGVVDIKVTKVGMLWRKDPKKKKTRSPWQEWGAILTGSQLYFFRNTSWVKNLMHQYENHQKAGRGHVPVIFRPPLEQFKPDFLVSMDHAIALIDHRYKKHKYAFLFNRNHHFSEVFLADNDAEMRDWLAKLNYAATYRTTGVRMRDITTGVAEERSSQDSGRTKSKDSESSTNENEEPPVPISEDLTQEQQIMVARRQIMRQKLEEAEERVAGTVKSLDTHLRTGRHLKLLTPIQERSRDDLLYATTQLAELLRRTRIDMWRFKCHCTILSLDLNDDDTKPQAPEQNADGDAKSPASPPNSKETKEGRLPFGRFNSKSGQSSGQAKLRPSNTPSGGKLFSMDEIFRTPSRLRSGVNHKAKGSWELPPINFEQRGSTSPARDTKDGAADAPSVQGSEADSLPTQSQISQSLRRASSEAAAPEALEPGEHEALLQAGVLTPAIERTASSPQSTKDSRSNRADSNKERDPLDTEVEDTGILEEDMRLVDIEDKETRRKVRHSLQRRLQVQGGGGGGSLNHGHHRSHSASQRRKNRDSSSTVTPADSWADTANEGAEQLTRGENHFTFHGKKASVVQFSGDWSSIGLKRVGTDPTRRASSDGLRASFDGRASRYSMEIGVRRSMDTSDTDAATTTAELRSPVSFKSACSSLEGPADERKSVEVKDIDDDDELSPRTTVTVGTDDEAKDDA